MQHSLGFLGIVIGLQPQPETRRCAEKSRQPQGCVCRDVALTGANGRNVGIGDANGFCQSILADLQWDEKFLTQHLAGMDIG